MRANDYHSLSLPQELWERSAVGPVVARNKEIALRYQLFGQPIELHTSRHRFTSPLTLLFARFESDARYSSSLVYDIEAQP